MKVDSGINKIHRKKLETNSLKSRTLYALYWSFLERIGQQGIQFIISIILARLLLPAEFGLIGMLTIFMALAQSFIDSGFGQALIQKQGISHVDECSIFYFNVLVGFLAAGLMCFTAPWIAAFYNQPVLVGLTYALSINLIFNAFGLVQTTLLTKRIDFKPQFIVGVIASIFSGGIGVTMAFNGFGVWSLVIQSLSSNFFRTALLWRISDWRPSLVFSFTSLRAMFVFGSHLLASGILNTLFENIYLVVIGKVFSPVSLGLYSRARSLQQLPVLNITSVVNRVTFPVFSSMQDEKQKLKRGVQKSLSMMLLLIAPMMIGLAIVAETLVVVLLTEKWIPCVPYLRLFCAVGVLYPLHVINLNVLKAQGRSDLFLRLEILKKILIVIAIIITYRWGVVAIIYGQIVTSIFAYFLNAYYTGKMINYSIKEQINDIIPIICIASIMGGGVYIMSYVGIDSKLVLLMLQVVVGILIYIAINYIFKVPVFVEFVEIIKLMKSKFLHDDLS